MPYKQGVTGSNPVVPTQQNRSPFTQVDGFRALGGSVKNLFL